jgi:hypothetical protein
MSKFVAVLITSLAILLSACTGLNRQDLRQLNSVISLNNNVSIKRQRHFVISPASIVALQVTLSPSATDLTEEILGSRQLILNSFKQHFQRVELFDNTDSIGSDFDFIVMVNLLNIVTSPKQLIDIDQQVDKTQRHEVIRAADTAALITDVVIKKRSSLNASTNTVASDEVGAARQEKVEEPVAQKEADGQQVSLIKANMIIVEPVTKTSITPLQALIKLSLIDARSNQLIDVALIDAYSSSIRKPSYDSFLMDTINYYANKITIM